MALEPVLVLGSLAVVAFFVRGLTGAASAIVFNAAFAALLSLGLAGGVSLLDGLYWIALTDVTASVVMLVALRTELRLEPFLVRFLAGSLPVAVVVTLLLPLVDPGALALGLAIVVVAVGSYLVLAPRLHVLPERTIRRIATPVGGLAGVLGGLYGMQGPVFMVFLSHVGGTPSEFRTRATVLGLAGGLVRVSVLALSGAFTAQELGWWAATIPFVLGGLWLGFRLHPRVRPRPFRVLLGSTVVVAGLVVLVRTLAG